MIKLDRLQIHVPRDFRGRESELVNAVAVALADVRVGASVNIDRLGSIRILVKQGLTPANAGRLIADGIASRIPSATRGGADD